MERRAHGAQHPVIQTLITGQVGIGWGGSLVDDLTVSPVLQESHALPYRFPQPLTVPGFLQVVVVHAGLDVGICGNQAEFSLAHREVEPAVDAVGRVDVLFNHRVQGGRRQDHIVRGR